MPNAFDKEALLCDNLKDAGCPDDLTKECISCYQDGTLQEMLPELKKQRKSILQDLKSRQKQIDCLDYLTRKIENEEY